MYQTTYHRPSSVDEAASLFAKGSESKYLAGGHTLIPVMKQRLASPSDVIDLGKIKELVGIEASADTLTIKAATTYFDIMQSADVKKSIPGDRLPHLDSRRPRGTSSRHDRRLDRQQRPGCGFSRSPGFARRDGEDQQALDIGGRLLQGPVHDGPRRWRDHHRRVVPDPGEGGLCQVSPPRLALRADRRVRDQDQVRRRQGRSDRRIAERRHAGAGDRGGAEGQLVGRSDRRREGFRQTA